MKADYKHQKYRRKNNKKTSFLYPQNKRKIEVLIIIV